MAFYRDYSNELVSHRDLEDKGVGHTGSRAHNTIEIDLNSSKDCFEMKADGHYHDNGEADTIRLQDDINVVNDNKKRASTSQDTDNRAVSAGRWGSSFWKDCQPMGPFEGSETAHESRSGSECRNEVSDDNTSDGRHDRLGSDDFDGQKSEKVPADEMLSDEYYEQDGDDQNDSLPYRGHNEAETTYSKFQSRQDLPSSIVSRSRVVYEDDDYEEEEEEDEDEVEDGDDPADADFEPDYEAPDVPSTKKDDDWEIEDSDEDEDVDSEEEIQMSDDNSLYRKKPRGAQLSKSGRNFKAATQRKPFAPPSRRRRGRISDDESAEDSEDDSDEDIRKRRGSNQRKSGNCRKNETRTSTRSVRKVSYAESEDSDEFDEGKKKSSQKEEIEEEDGDAIEKVLWHQPKGIAEEALRGKRSTDPVLMRHLFDSEPGWDDMEFLIKWKGQSHLHCQWKPLSELHNLSGFKKVLNYMKRIREDVRFRKSVSREEIEVHDVSKEMDLDLFKQNCQVSLILLCQRYQTVLVHDVAEASF